MPAPNLETLLDFETNVESAAKIFLAADTGLNASSVFATLDQSTFVTPRLVVSFELSEAVDPPDLKAAESPELEYHKYAGVLTVQVISDGAVNGSMTAHRQLRGKVRASLLLNAENFTKDVSGERVLPYYDVNYLRPTGTTIDAEDDILVSTLEYQMNLVIRNDAWVV